MTETYIYFIQYRPEDLFARAYKNGHLIAWSALNSDRSNLDAMKEVLDFVLGEADGGDTLVIEFKGRM